ncbi:MAG TPA: hypothetical protein VMK12_05000 [Anaeromyxobacteraceae bacterium]|nr:hypothetical protein [Anaeromyxobacteraceae bacterium]
MTMKLAPALKLRGWKLENGQILILVFLRLSETDESELKLLREEYAKDDADVRRIVDEAKAHVDAAMKEAGLQGFALEIDRMDEGPKS